jgi:hypothetical protein
VCVWEILYTRLLQHSIQAFLLIKEEEKEGWLAYFALLAIHMTKSMHYYNTQKRLLTSLYLLCDHSFNNLCEMQTWLWVDSLSNACALWVACSCSCSFIWVKSSRNSLLPPPGPQHHKQASKQASNLP